MDKIVCTVFKEEVTSDLARFHAGLISWWICNLECWFLWEGKHSGVLMLSSLPPSGGEGRKAVYSEQIKPWKQRENQRQTQPHWVGIAPRPLWWGGERFHLCAMPSPPNFHENGCSTVDSVWYNSGIAAVNGLTFRPFYGSKGNRFLLFCWWNVD